LTPERYERSHRKKTLPTSDEQFEKKGTDV